MNQTVTYLQELTAIPSPTGFTREIADYLVKTIEGFGYEVTRTAKGGVNVTVPGVITDKQRYVTAHVDTLGAIVRAVKADGRLKLDRIGGFPWNMIEGENCTVHVAITGKAHSGTILVHQTSCHVYKDAGTVERTQDNMEVRLDEKVTNEKETRALGIEVGDFVSFDPRTIVTPDGTVRANAGDVVDTITTDEEGKAETKELYLGKYQIVEKTAPEGLVLNTETHEVELTYAGQEASVTEADTAFYNERQKVTVDLTKTLE